MPEAQELGALDQFDLKLLAALEADGRLTNAELAEKIGLSASQCSRRRIRLEETGIIEGYSAHINDLILPQASVSHVKSSIVLTTLKDSHRLPLRAAKSAS
jgi:DNA-binding Lrp family transcriptional regulator